MLVWTMSPLQSPPCSSNPGDDQHEVDDGVGEVDGEDEHDDSGGEVDDQHKDDGGG